MSQPMGPVVSAPTRPDGSFFAAVFITYK